ncbi:hypothetical protein DOTSEDRAFT_74616 [Dothistroma septosporum NZE10]|uniref:Uncharacterized protein n=1 Tax=Dothistroma septosporum (strain NZE10 / CBS 128990) TaxID=675120 RepID=N1PES5_DOTSN|nr:hypothetical protein DOTSEDRAFT_74616 [Dothistroma septosporum NZE10]
MSHSDTPLQYCSKQKVLLEVLTDDVQILSLASSKQAIGTKHLNGCTCVVVFGSAVILAHISPLPGRAQEWDNAQQDLLEASRAHHDRILGQVGQLLNQYASEFPASTTTWGVFGHHPQRGVMRSVQQRVQGYFKDLGHDMRPAFYEEIDASKERPKRPKGELVVVRAGKWRGLYLERNKLWPKTEAAGSSSSSRDVASSSRVQGNPDEGSGRKEEEEEEEEEEETDVSTSEAQRTGRLQTLVAQAKSRRNALMSQSGYSLAQAVTILKGVLMQQGGLNEERAVRYLSQP